MKKYLILLQRLLYILAFLPLLAKADYDSLDCIAVDQSFTSREAVVNNDVIGVWMQNWTYLGSDASLSIKDNWNSAFGLHGDSIYVVDYTQINGKIVQSDTIIKITIESQADDNTEVDTAFIYFTEASDCNLDPSDEDMGSPEAGKGYFFSRGSTFDGYGSSWEAIIGTVNNPTVVGAYGRGARPKFNGNHSQSNFLWIGSTDDVDQVGDRCDNLIISDLELHNYDESIIKIKRTSDSIYVLNSWLHNGDRDDTEAMLTFNTQTYDDSTATYYFKVQNCRFDTVGIDSPDGGEQSGIKIGAGKTETINCYFGDMSSMGVSFQSGCAYRIAGGHGHTAKHLYFAGETTDYYPIQVRGDTCLLEDIVVENYTGGTNIFGINSAGGETGMNGDSIVFDNIYVNNCNMNQGFYFDRDGTDVSPNDDIYIRNFYFRENTFSNADIYITEGRTIVIERGLMSDAGVKILCADDGGIEDLHINYNIAYNAVDEEFTLDGGGVYVYNNTIDGEINNTLCALDTTRNNFYITLTGELFEENNIDIDGIETDNYFTDYEGHDYSILVTATGAIDEATDWGQTVDYLGNSKSGDEWDIGAYEYQQVASGTAETYIDGKLGSKTMAGKTVIFLKPQ